MADIQDEELVLDTLYPLSKRNDIEEAKKIVEKYHLEWVKSKETALKLLCEAVSHGDFTYIKSLLELFPDINLESVRKEFLQSVETGYTLANINVYDGLLRNIMEIAKILDIPLSQLHNDELMRALWEDFSRFYSDYPEREQERFVKDFTTFFGDESVEKMFYESMFQGEMSLVKRKENYFDFATRFWYAHVFALPVMEEKAKAYILSFIELSQWNSLSHESALKLKGIMDVFWIGKEWITSQDVLKATKKWWHILSIARLFQNS